MIVPLPTDDTSVLPTFENRLAAYLRAHGVDLAPGEFVVREARLIRRLAALGIGTDEIAEVLAFVQARPHLLLGDEWGPSPYTGVDWRLMFPGPAGLECDSKHPGV